MSPETSSTNHEQPFKSKGLNWQPTAALLFPIFLIGFLFYQVDAIDKEVRKEKQSKSYTIKVLDEKGETKLLYKDKTIEVREGVLYVCPLKTLNCANNSKAIIVGGNFIVEQQN